MTTYSDQLFDLGGRPVAGGQDPSGVTYFIDGNRGGDGRDGFSWAGAYKTLAFGFAASHANIASGGVAARRNTIYISGDFFVEDLVALPQKTDVIGVGSADGRKGAGITGNHAPVNTTAGCRFYNVNFQAGTTADLWILTSVTSGLEFIGCHFLSGGTTPASGIDTTASTFLKVINCEFSGAFSANYIDIGPGAVDSMVIKDNIMSGGADNGIMVTGTATVTASRRGMIIGNFIECADIVIDVNSTSLFNVMDNVCISGETLGGSSYVIDLTFAARNLITGNDISVGVPSYTTVA